MREDHEERTINVAETRNILERRQSVRLKPTATPSVLNLEHFIASGASVTITDFANGQDCQKLWILGDGTTTVSNNSRIFTNTGASKILQENVTYIFTRFNNKWYEQSSNSSGSVSTSHPSTGPVFAPMPDNSIMTYDAASNSVIGLDPAVGSAKFLTTDGTDWVFPSLGTTGKLVKFISNFMIGDSIVTEVTNQINVAGIVRAEDPTSSARWMQMNPDVGTVGVSASLATTRALIEIISNVGGGTLGNITLSGYTGIVSPAGVVTANDTTLDVRNTVFPIINGAFTQRGGYFRSKYSMNGVGTIAIGCGFIVVGAARGSAYTTDNAYTVHIENPTLGTNQTLTNAYGIKIEDITSGGTINCAIKTGLGLIDLGDNVNLASGKVYKVNATQVVGARGAAVTALPSAPSGGAVQDAESRTAIGGLLTTTQDLIDRLGSALGHGLFT